MENNTYGLIGAKLGHSFSKNYFTKKFTDEGIAGEYLNFEIDSIDKLSGIIAGGVAGLNVTIPYKEAVISHLDAIDPVAQTIGAVNVIKIIRKNGIIRTVGYNSDIIGFRESVKPLLKTNHKRALILGTGGASKAVKAGLEQCGIECTYVSRHKSDNTLTYNELNEEIMSNHQVIINTTPLGMYPNIDTCPDIPYNLLNSGHLCYDLTYNPEVTKFLRLSAESGATTKNGLEMLIRQAEESWKIWNM